MLEKTASNSMSLFSLLFFVLLTLCCLPPVQCNLHIHASYSTSLKLNVPMLPLSEPNAVGLILAHGNARTLIRNSLKSNSVL